ncbi:hypothetical protein XENOCAPTIV_006775 [Xenoophorus captivus]|uniref:Uncharacterized protein n=1 Tax=Xenoophorus captivus TaxID=1517983 RepID=A0ABV0RB74_9TELE
MLNFFLQDYFYLANLQMLKLFYHLNFNPVKCAIKLGEELLLSPGTTALENSLCKHYVFHLFLCKGYTCLCFVFLHVHCGPCFILSWEEYQGESHLCFINNPFQAKIEAPQLSDIRTTMCRDPPPAKLDLST